MDNKLTASTVNDHADAVYLIMAYKFYAKIQLHRNCVNRNI